MTPMRKVGIAPSLYTYSSLRSPTAEAADLRPAQCQFKSDRRHMNEDQWFDKLPGGRHSKYDLQAAIVKCKRNPGKWLLYETDTDANRLQRLRRHFQKLEPSMIAATRTLNGSLTCFIKYEEEDETDT